MIKPTYSIYIPFTLFLMTCLRYLLVAIFLFVCLPANALTLGNAKVNSFINHNLDAKIEVLSPNKIYPDKLKAFLASKEVFNKYDLLRDSFLDSIRFSIIQEKKGKTYIHLTSKHTVREPLVSLIVTLRSLEGNITREYNLFLNPSPDTRIKRIQIPDIVTINIPDPNERFQQKKNKNAVKTLAQTKAAEKKLPKKDPFDSSSYKSPDLNFLIKKHPVVTTYGPIKRGTVMSLVAQKIRPNNTYSVQKIAKFLFQYNPDAFLNNDINKLKTGSILNVPDLNRPEFRKDSFAYLDQEEIQHQQSPLKQEEIKENIAKTPPMIDDKTSTIEHSEGELTLVSDDQTFLDEELVTDLQESNKEAKVAQKLLQISIGEIKLLKDENKLIRDQFDLLMGRMEEVINKNKLLDEELKALKALGAETNFTEKNNIKKEKQQDSTQEIVVKDSKIVEESSLKSSMLAKFDSLLAQFDSLLVQIKAAEINWSFWVMILFSIILLILITIVIISKWKNRKETVQEEFSLDDIDDIDDIETVELNNDLTTENNNADEVAVTKSVNGVQSQFQVFDKKETGNLLETGLPDIDFSSPPAPKPQHQQKRSFGLQLDESDLSGAQDQDNRDFDLKLDELDLANTEDPDDMEFDIDLDELSITSDNDPDFNEMAQDSSEILNEVDEEINKLDLYSVANSEQKYHQESTVDTPKVNFTDVLGPAKTSDNIDLLSQSSVYFAYGKFDLAEKLLIEGIETTPNNNQLKLKLFECYAKMDNEIKFLSYLEQERELYTQDNEFNEKVKKMYLNSWDKEVL